MKWFVGISLIAIAGGAAYVALRSGEQVWLAVAVTAVLGLAGMWCCLRWARYAALFAAISLLTLTVVGQGLHKVSGTVNSDATGPATFHASFEGPSPWPTLIGAALLLTFQGLLEIVERRWFPKLADRLSLGWVASTGQNSTTIVNPETGDIASATVGDGNQGQVAVGSGNTQVQFNTDVDGEIQSAADLLSAGRLRSADAAFQKINTRYGSSLTEHQRYRIVANQAIVCAKNSQHERAAALFTQASGLTTERNVTDRLLAQAASLRGQHEKAVEIAQQVVERDRSDRQAAALRVSNDRSERPTEEIRGELVDEIRDSLEVLYACIIRESSIGRFESSERFARIAIRKYPDDREVQIELARAIICRFEQKYGQRSIPSTLSADEKQQLAEAISLATAVLRDQELELSESNRTDLYSMRGLARSLLGSRDDALADWDEAAVSSSSIERHLIPYVVRLHEAGREDEAIARMKPAVENSGDLTLASLYAELLHKRNDTGDRTTAAMALSRTLKNAVDASSADLTTAFADLASVSISAETSDDSGFFDLLEQTRDRLSDIGWRTVLANAALAGGDETEADIQASLAILAIPTASHEFEAGQLAITLNQLGRHAECANLMNSLCLPDRDSQQVRMLLEAAHNAELDELVLEHSRRLREHGVYVERLLKHEAAVLARYLAIDQLTELLKDAGRNCSSPAVLNWIRFMRSLAAVDVGRLELVEGDPSRLPMAGDLHVENLANFSKVMRFGPGYREGIDQIYALMRADRGAVIPQQVFFALMSLGGDQETIHDPDTVCSGAAVFVSQSSGPDRWCIIEEGEKPDPTQNEFAVDSPVVKPLIGKRVGESAVVTSGLSTNTLTVRRIVDKRNYSKMRIMESYPDSHPEDGFLLRFDAAGPDGKLDPRILGVQMRYWEDEKKQQIEFYRQYVVPLSWIARAANRPLASAWMHVTRTVDLPLRIVVGTEKEISQAAEALQSDLPLVLEPTAAMTILYTGFWKCLKNTGIEIIVPMAVLNDVWCLIADSPYQSDGCSTLQVAGDRAYAEDGNLEGWARHRWRVGLFLIWLQTDCRLVDCLPLAKIAPQRRKSLINVFGFSATSAIAVAADSRAALWTDDLAVASAAAEFGVSHRVWTPVVADDCVTRGTVDESEALALRTDMLSYGAINLPLDPAVLLQAGERAQWDPRESPLQGICRWFANPDLVAGFVLQVLTASLSALHQRDLMWHQEEATCLAMFRATSQRPDGNALLKALHQETPNLFRLEVIHQDRIQGLIKRAAN